jgi:pimeloyl-ACP methyl ester carboxylesterase
MAAKAITYREKKISYTIEGNGPIVLLIHGFGEDSSVWKNQIDFLKNDFRLIVPDLPGSGRSEIIDDMSMEGMAEVMKAILEKECAKVSPSGGDLEGGDRAAHPAFTIIGHSMGGYIALAFAEKYEERLNGFGLLHSTAYPDSEEKKSVRKKGIEFMKQHGGFEFLKTSSPNLFSPQTKDEMPGLADQFIDGLRNFKAVPLVSYYQAMMQRPDRRAVLEKINVAVLLIAGEYDNAVPLKDSLALAHLPQKAYFHVLKKSGHMGMLEEAEKTNRLLLNYLKDLNPNSD